MLVLMLIVQRSVQIVFLHACMFIVVQAGCPDDCNCDDRLRPKCRQGTLDTVLKLSSNPGSICLSFEYWSETKLNLSLFDGYGHLEDLNIAGGKASQLIAPDRCHLPSLINLTATGGRISQVDGVRLASCAALLKSLNLSRNSLSEMDLSLSGNLTRLDLSSNSFVQFPVLPRHLQFLTLSDNDLTYVGRRNVSNLSKLVTLDLSHNRLTHLSGDAFLGLKSLQTLLLGWNRLASVPEEVFRDLNSLRLLDLSHNRIVHFGSIIPEPCSLLTMNFDGNPLESVPRIRCSSLQTLQLSETTITYVRVNHFREVSNLRVLNISHSYSLQSFVGRLRDGLASLEMLDASGCALESLPSDFFEESSLALFKAEGNNWHCDCRLRWVLEVPRSVQLLAPNVSTCLMDVEFSERLQNCSGIGIAAPNGRIQWIRLAKAAYVRCGEYGYSPPSVLWEVFRFGDVAAFEPVCAWDAESHMVVRYSNDKHLTCIPGGALRVMAMQMDDGAPLRCRVRNGLQTAYSVVMLHFDFSFWHDIKVNSFICALAVMCAFIVINITYIFVRRLVAWRISRMERTGLVRRTLEAMERYRQRQLEALYDMYTNRMQMIVDNCHQQMDQIKKSYMLQSDRFRDYRTAQMETVSQHLDSLYGSYAEQVSRVRDYGSRRMESLWDSYQRQLNRLRSFTVQQRLRMMRQYRLKQKYFAKLLEGFYSDQTKSNEDYRFIDPVKLQLPEWTPEELQCIPLVTITPRRADSEASSSGASKPQEEEQKEKRAGEKTEKKDKDGKGP